MLPPDVRDPRADERQQLNRRDCVLEGLEKGWPLREDPHDRRIFHAPAPLDGFLPIARKLLTLEQLEEAQKLVYSGDIRYKPKEGDATATAAPPASTSERRVIFLELAPSTAAPAAADSSSEGEDVLKLLAEDDEVTGVAAALAKSSVARFASEELDEAELTIYRQLQKERYPKAYETLQLGLPIHQKEKIAALNPVWDERDKLIRISGRVILALRDKNRASDLATR